MVMGRIHVVGNKIVVIIKNINVEIIIIVFNLISDCRETRHIN